MKRCYLICILACLSVFCTFMGCKKDKDEEIAPSNPVAKIEATSIQSEVSGVATVKAVSPEGYEVVSSAYSGKFTLVLPETLPENKTEALGSVSGVKVSNPSVRVLDVYSVTGYSTEGKPVGEFIYGKAESATVVTTAVYRYADGDVTVTGKLQYEDDGKSYTDNYNINLKKGWNMMYITYLTTGNTFTITTSPKSGLIWIFDSDTDISTSATKIMNGIRPSLTLSK